MLRSYGMNICPLPPDILWNLFMIILCFLPGSDFLRASSTTSLSSPVASHDAEDDHNHHQKKSVLTKVKEKAKKLKHSLSTKKKHHDNDSHETDTSTPSWSANLNDNEVEEEEDGEYLGAPSNILVNLFQK